ncbi:tetraacyldisaccharide 4'-kinase [Glaciecola petra]|uniref:Tetraacyldisaccharide 4'-kinase n=1 Tax=Glaciecola petra TaxID=3075602 RepID=A0ABU2ZPZ7_9ALTE|nr:tetraacyldisaccharide 4'-kinase [Aestuariibacter sp. P117]MDT0594485.1 tetraacyldisaccharide 4'-kinase [Aestuariibacter sp. P117]
MMATTLQRWWYNNSLLVWLLLPFTLIFWSLSALRRLAFIIGIKKQYKSKIPIVIVGNISVGGNGKTPLVICLVEYFKAQGYTPVVLSRGYGGQQKDFPHVVTHNCPPGLVGDEPALLKNRLKCEVLIDPKRARACKYVELNTDADIIICDDGLQHYALGRDIELCVIDKRGLGNGCLLPMGPLRESAKRLSTVDTILFNANDEQFAALQDKLLQNVSISSYQMRLKATHWVNLCNDEIKDVSYFSSFTDKSAISAILAMAGIGDPQRFFDTLDALNIAYKEAKSYPDHYHFSEIDIPQNYTVLMTEKDAIKCKHFAHKDCWYLRVDASIDDAFYKSIEQKIKN